MTGRATGRQAIYRVRWRGSWWKPRSATQVRYYAQGGHAEARARRLTAEGYTVELTAAERGPWEPWPT